MGRTDFLLALQTARVVLPHMAIQSCGFLNLACARMGVFQVFLLMVQGPACVLRALTRCGSSSTMRSGVLLTSKYQTAPIMVRVHCPITALERTTMTDGISCCPLIKGQLGRGCFT